MNIVSCLCRNIYFWLIIKNLEKGDSNLQNEQGAEAISHSGKNVEFLR